MIADGWRRLRSDPPTQLAVLRIVVVSIVLLTPATKEAVQWGSASSIAPLPGLWSLPIPVSPALARLAQLVLVGGCFAALVGLYTRAALVLATVSSLYVLGLPQRMGNVVHHHHLVWLLALLAASPCGDALAVDAGPRRHDRAYTAPLDLARLMFGCIYLFPGLWKLNEQGLGFATSDNLRNQLWWKWAQYDWVPAFRIDRHPRLLLALGLGTIVFELGFIVLVWFRRTRLVALGAGLAFHFGTAWLMKIEFPSLWLCYLGLLGDDEREHWLRGAERSALVGVGLLVAIAVQGLRGEVRAWPFACYPTFHHRVGAEMPDLVITGSDAAGRTVTLFGHPHPQAEWGVAWSLAGLQGGFDAARLAAFMRGRAPPGTVLLRAERVSFSVDPDARGRVVRREVLLEFTP